MQVQPGHERDDDLIADEHLVFADWFNERRIGQQFGLRRRLRPIHLIFRIAGLGGK